MTTAFFRVKVKISWRTVTLFSITWTWQCIYQLVQRCIVKGLSRWWCLNSAQLVFQKRTVIPHIDCKEYTIRSSSTYPRRSTKCRLVVVFSGFWCRREAYLTKPSLGILSLTGLVSCLEWNRKLFAKPGKSLRLYQGLTGLTVTLLKHLWSFGKATWIRGICLLNLSSTLANTVMAQAPSKVHCWDRLHISHGKVIWWLDSYLLLIFIYPKRLS